MSELERRSFVELRAEASRIIGHAIVFDVRSQDLGGFFEIVRPAAVDRALTGDVVALYAHNAEAVLGRTPKTLQLTKDARGLAFTLDVAPTQAGRDALELVRRGDITGASFAFKTLKDAWTRAGGQVVRELLDVEIREISLTAFPVYQQTDVSVALRALRGQFGSQSGQATVHRSVTWLRREARLR